MGCSAVGFIVTLILSLLAAPLAVNAQPEVKVYRIGWLRIGTPSGLETNREAFRQGLRDLGYVEGHNLVIEYRYAEGHLERLHTLAAELVALQPDVILTAGTLGRSYAEAYRALGMQEQRVEARHADDLDPAFRAIVAGGVDALFISQDGLFIREAPRITAFALQHRLPTMAGDLGFARAGGLMVYSASTPDMFRRAASYVDKILQGAKPADLPVERADKFVLVINLKTAQALGITIPPTLLLLADEVIR